MLLRIKKLLAFAIIGWNLVSILMVTLPDSDFIWIVSFIFSMFLSIPVYMGLIENIVGRDKIEEANDAIGRIYTAITEGIFYLICFLAICLGVLLFFLQCYLYLKDGSWTPFSIITGLQYFELHWATYPSDWKGLWNILNKIPLPLALVATSAASIATKLENT